MTDLNNYREILDEALDIAKNIATDFDTFSDAQDYVLELAGENRSLDDLMTYMAFATMHELVRKQYFLLQDEAA